MKTIQPVHEVMSLFGVTSKNQALAKPSANRGLIISVVSAFFVVLVLGMLLSILPKAINGESAAASVISDQQESVAFQPGQFVTKEITRGYLGK